MNRTDKIEAAHIRRKAVLYIRQSTMRQVYENTESTLRQYALKEKLIRLGWDEGMVEIIDCDLGRSGADAACRNGFRQMLADVGEGNVGAVACIECSRLSRSSGDWGRLTEICALSGTILIDDDGVYDPNDFNDRLLLGLKGTMSEAELHFLHDRMRGGALNKARRGELRGSLPVGYLYDEAGKVVKDPDIQVQEAISLFFESFRICGTAHRLAIYYGEKGYLIPTDRNKGFGNGADVYWDVLTPSRAQNILRSPTYAGVYSYGKIQTRTTMKGKRRIPVPEEQWLSDIEDHHEAYITLDEYRANCETLSSNSSRNGASPPREGNALLQGIIICARCGNQMTVTYKKIKGTLHGSYVCGHIQKGEPYSYKRCLCINGRTADREVSEAILQKLTPEAVKMAWEIQQELEKRKHNADSYFALQVEKAKYEAGMSRKRYLNADPENRLVSAELERLWNEKLKQLAHAEAELKNHESASGSMQKEEDLEKLLNLPEKLQETWWSDAISMIDKKRIIRCLVEDVTLNMLSDVITIGIRYKGGMTEYTEVPRPPKQYETWTTSPEIVEYVREASKEKTVGEMVKYLNSHSRRSGKGLEFTLAIVRGIQHSYGITPLRKYLRSIGYLSTKEKAEQMRISPNALNKRRANGKFEGKPIKTTVGGDYMYEP